MKYVHVTFLIEDDDVPALLTFLESIRPEVHALTFSTQDPHFSGVERIQDLESYPLLRSITEKRQWYIREGFSLHIARKLARRITPKQLLEIDLEEFEIQAGIGPATTQAIAAWREWRSRH